MNPSALIARKKRARLRIQALTDPPGISAIAGNSYLGNRNWKVKLHDQSGAASGFSML